MEKRAKSKETGNKDTTEWTKKAQKSFFKETEEMNKLL